MRVAGAICGIQAQVMSAAELALRARVRGLRRQDVRDALWRDRSLVKTWCMRGAVHLIPSSDLSMFLGALRQPEARAFSWIVRDGLSAKGIDEAVRAIERALGDGPLRRRELADRVGQEAGAAARRWVSHSWGGVVKVACARGLVCFGPDEENEVTFVRMEDWLPGVEGLPVSDAKVRLLRRYLKAYGPATGADYTLWTGLTAPGVRETWGAIGSEIHLVDVGGRRAWILREDLASLRHSRGSEHVVNLLPSFDALLLGHKDKGHLVDAAHYKRVYRKAGWLSPVVLVDGRVFGVWSYHRRGEHLDIALQSFQTVTRAVREGIEAEAEDLRRFLEVRHVRIGMG